MLSRTDNTSALTASRLLSALAWLHVSSCSACVATCGAQGVSAHSEAQARGGARGSGARGARLLQTILQHHVCAKPQAHRARVLQHRLRRGRGALRAAANALAESAADLGENVVRQLKLNARRLRARLHGVVGQRLRRCSRGRGGAAPARLLGQQQDHCVKRFLQVGQLLLQPHALLQQPRLRRARASAAAARPARVA